MKELTSIELIVLIVNAPILAGIFAWIIKVEKQLTKIETTCKDRKKRGECDAT